ncbi:DUF2680 domain-containing protein [Desulfosporosinus fructosivorans]
MNKKLAAGALSVVLLIGGATAAFGATDPDKLAEIKTMTQQMFGLQKQIVDKEVEAGLRTAEQADKMKKFIDQRQQASDQALAEGKVFNQGMRGKGMRGDVTKFNNAEPMTSDQIKAWSEQAQARLTAQVEAMKKNSKLTADQIQTWSDAEQAQLKVQAEAMANGTFIPGGMGKGMRGGAKGSTIAPTAPTTSTPTDTQ